MLIVEKSTPFVFAHRGASAYAPENTLAAFKFAIDQGADGIELDTKLSVDGQAMVMHDLSVDRTTNGKGLISTLSASEIQKLDAGSHFSPDFEGEPVPTLEDVFKLVGRRIVINIELTNYSSPTDALPVFVSELIKKYHLEDKVIISSFHPLNLIRFHRLIPGIPLGLLTLPGKPGAWGRSWIGRLVPQDALHPYFSDVNFRLVEGIHQRGKKINVWTVDSPAEITRLVSLKVDGIITNDPKTVKGML
jgi:glycerophosphoryl diester phosphodiesterase